MQNQMFKRTNLLIKVHIVSVLFFQDKHTHTHPVTPQYVDHRNTWRHNKSHKQKSNRFAKQFGDNIILIKQTGIPPKNLHKDTEEPFAQPWMPTMYLLSSDQTRFIEGLLQQCGKIISIWMDIVAVKKDSLPTEPAAADVFYWGWKTASCKECRGVCGQHAVATKFN